MNPLIGKFRPTLIEGYAIVSADSMIADASGAMDALKFDADQQFFWASLDAAAAVAYGRHSAEGGPRCILPKVIAGPRYESRIGTLYSRTHN